MKTKTVTDEKLIKVTDAIRRAVPVHSIYLIASKNETIQRKCVLLSSTKIPERGFLTYTVLIITHSLISDTRIFMNDLYNKMNERIEVVSIHYTLREVQSRLTMGDNFLSLVIRESQLVYTEDDQLMNLPIRPLYHPIILQEIKNQWLSRYRRGTYFKEKGAISGMTSDTTARFLILQHSIKQICAGLLYVFWEFKPTYFSLSFLLHLCHQFTAIPEIIFPKRSFRSQRIYNALCHATYNLNHQTGKCPSAEDAEKAYNLCYRFIKEAEKLVTHKLKELELLHQRTNIPHHES